MSNLVIPEELLEIIKDLLAHEKSAEEFEQEYLYLPLDDYYPEEYIEKEDEGDWKIEIQM